MKNQFEIEAFYDEACPLCRSEVNFIRRLDRQQKILFTNIADLSFDATAYGRTQDQLMNEMHARLSDGSWITGVEVFRRLYAAVGFGWLVSMTRLYGVSQILDLLYRIFASKRLSLTGRCHAANKSCAVPPETSEVQV
ncbi:MAG: DUF393 domain-containing protein [Gimesia sp.]|nr:DUF393 domain-containing protein [Gimesia sp.]